MNKQHPILLFVILALLATAPFSNAQAQQPSEEQLARILKRFPEADADKDGKLIRRRNRGRCANSSANPGRGRRARPQRHNRRRLGMRFKARERRVLRPPRLGRVKWLRNGRRPVFNRRTAWAAAKRRFPKAENFAYSF